MKPFMDENFLLQSHVAEYLYHEHAGKMPIIDYHCHLSPQEIAEDKIFDNLSQLWLNGDHYKWRAMRTNGIPEKYCTGNASDYEKFEKWTETVPYTIRNPLYHWTHLELKRYFGIDKILNPLSAKEIYDEASSKINSKEYSVRNLMLKMNVEVVCTTDDPTDNLEHHKKIQNDKFKVKVLSTWRPDAAMMVDDPGKFNNYLDKLSNAANISISKFGQLIEALQKRHDYFAENGCKLSDHGLETVYAEDYTLSEINSIFDKIRIGNSLLSIEILKFKSAMLHEFGLMDFEKGWAQQFHIGALRNNNSKLFRELGPDKGFDSIGDFEIGRSLSKFLDQFDRKNKLAKTIIYNLNPRDNELIATMLGNFQDGSVPGKIQMGSGWWFLDQKDGMERQLNAISNLGLLSRFIGMLTDSRSFLSYPRHEYFRRILCNLLGNDVMNGEIPYDKELLGTMVENISYFNALNYFWFNQTSKV
jgi:glucuronate isomerase